MQIINDKGLRDYYIKKSKIKEYIKNENLEKYIKIHEYKNKEVIYNTNQVVDYFYMLLEGKANIYINLKNGKSLLIKIYSPIEFLGDMEFVSGENTQCEARALEKTILLGIKTSDLEILTKDDTDFYKFISKALASKLKNASNSAAINLLYPVENRLCEYLMINSNYGEDLEFEIDKLKYVAETLGSSYRHIQRIIKQLIKEEIIEKNKNKIKIKNLDKIKELSSETYHD
ncbi:MAG: cyclic nucleotide-binding domain-containing protein [Peptostreptococcaceae bacterium]|jgi:CRP-like cAMP-binding protein|nr:cyclic nucleotide-binding domain-containing protein [Peptostreptococcaceae bacterium]